MAEHDWAVCATRWLNGAAAAPIRVRVGERLDRGDDGRGDRAVLLRHLMITRVPVSDTRWSGDLSTPAIIN